MPLMNKYHAKKVKTSDGVFDSQKEYLRWVVLKDKADKGEIRCLRRQVTYILLPTQTIDNKVVERPVKYIADFVYTVNGMLVVEDVKSNITRKKPDYIIKRKLMLFEHGIRIQEI